MENPDDLYYTREHTWVRVAGSRGTVGITDHAQQELGEILFVERTEVGSLVEKHDTLGTLESAKTVAELYSPVGGEISSVNKDLEDEPSLINDDPYGNGWLLVLELDDPKELEDLLSAAEYEEFLEKEKEEARAK
ncbi:MAG: glycine cleavage system protein GcvH [Deltaproteobacteria bacterium]|nr:glycine cleavage system protein GcvH [Deltaproteobacteria bacterium]